MYIYIRIKLKILLYFSLPLCRDYGWEEQDVLLVFMSLKERGLIKSMEYNSYTRIHHEDKEIKVSVGFSSISFLKYIYDIVFFFQVVKQMPTIASNKQPTIAIITAQYCEKLAVDAMLENKETFVRYTTVGESLSFIGIFLSICKTWLHTYKHTF